MNPLRRQLPAYSPINAGSLFRAFTAAFHNGDALDQLRVLLARDYAAHTVLLCGSGTQALQLAIQTAAQPYAPDAPVAIPAFTCFDVGSAAVGANRPLHLFDVDPATLAPDLDSVRAVLEAGARVVVACPLYGLPIEWEALERLAAEYGAALIENAAQGHGAAWRARPLGTLGAVSLLSFGRGKGWTGGHGGALLLRGSATAVKSSFAGTRSDAAALLLALGAQWMLGRPPIYELPASIPWLGLGKTVFHEPVPPVPLATAAAAALLQTHATAGDEAIARKVSAQFWVRHLSESDEVVLPTVPAGADPGYIRFPIRMRAGRRDSAFEKTAARAGIAASYPHTLDKLPALRRLLADADRRYPGAETLVQELITLPTHSLLSASDRRLVLDLMRAR